MFQVVRRAWSVVNLPEEYIPSRNNSLARIGAKILMCCLIVEEKLMGDMAQRGEALKEPLHGRDCFLQGH